MRRFSDRTTDFEEGLPVGVDLNVAGEKRQLVVGVDLGQKKDFTAVAVVERSDVVYQERSALTYRRYGKCEFRLRFLERLELGLSYPGVVDAISELVYKLKGPGPLWFNAPPIALVVDATGVGTAVVDLLKKAGLECELAAVTITAGERESQNAFGWNVPKRDLVSELEVMYDNDELLMANDLDFGDELIEELTSMEVKQSEKGRERFGAWREGQHDDLVLAVALAVWRAKKGTKSPWGKVRLV
jgi:hypothetical protein